MITFHNVHCCLLFAFSLILSSALGDKVKVHSMSSAGVAAASTAGWTHGGQAAPTVLHTVTIALKQQNLDLLEEAFRNVTDPSHSDYQQWLTPAAIHAMTALPAKNVGSILSWLKEHGIGVDGTTSVKYVQGSDAIVVRASVAQLQQLFSAQFSNYSHADLGNHVRLGPGQDAHVPGHVAPHIDLVSGLTTMPHPLKKAISHFKPEPTQSAYYDDPNLRGRHRFHSMQTTYYYNILPVPALIQYYGLPDRSGSTSKSSTISLGVYEPGNAYFKPSDLADYSYFQSASHSTSQLTADHILGNANNANVDANGEATLDIEAITAVNPGAQSYYILDVTSNWYEFALWFQSFPTASLPQTFSISWSIGEDWTFSNDGVPASQWYSRANLEWMKIGMRGITVTVASGDSGPGGCTPSTYSPAYPATSPYVLSVGASFTGQGSSSAMYSSPSSWCSATTSQFQSLGVSTGGLATPFVLRCPVQTTESASGYYGGGGGWSHIAANPQPSYQAAAVAAYIASGVSLPAGYYNPSYRAYPDVSMSGGGAFPTIEDGALGFTGGTSLAAPLWSAVISLMNEISLAHGGKTVGFVNPLLYQMQASDPSTFHDVVTGTNAQSGSSCTGYQATTGWDAATGLGSPNWPRMSQWLTNYYTNSLGCKGLGYDFSSLSNSDMSLVSGGYTWYFRSCSRVSACASNFPASQFCQTSGANQWTIADYAPSQMVWSSISNGVQVTIADGQSCGAAPRKAVIQYVCLSSASTPVFASVTESPQCTYTAVIQTTIVCTPAPAPPGPSTTIAGCGFNGKDLSALSQYDLSATALGYTWYFRSCAPVSASICASTFPSAQACQVTGSTAWDIAEFLPPTNTIAQWSTITNGIQYVVQDGTVCGSYSATAQRKLTVQYTCSSTATHPTTFAVSEPSTCNYLIQIATSLVC